MSRKSNILSGTLLIAGTAIGAGMLAMPLVTVGVGFFPSLLLNVACWLFMTSTAFLLLEAVLWLPEGAHFLSLSRYFLGRPGEIIGGASFVFLYYCLLVSYVSGGAPIAEGILRGFFGLGVSPFLAQMAFTLFFAAVVALGVKTIDRVNYALMMGMIISYVGLLGAGTGEIRWELLERHSWTGAALAFPVLFSAFGFHNIIPSLAGYFHRDGRVVRWAIGWGASIVFVVYSVWQWLVLGTIPETLLQEAAAKGVTVAEALQQVTGSPWVRRFGVYFSFFALVTSLLGVSFSMVDFLGDGLRVKRKGWPRVGLVALVFGPPFVLTLTNPGIFIEAISYAGGFGEAILNGLFPIAMVWMGRYHMNLPSSFQLPGGRLYLGVLTSFTLFVAWLQAKHLIQGIVAVL